VEHSKGTDGSFGSYCVLHGFTLSFIYVRPSSCSDKILGRRFLVLARHAGQQYIVAFSTFSNHLLFRRVNLCHHDRLRFFELANMNIKPDVHATVASITAMGEDVRQDSIPNNSQRTDSTESNGREYPTAQDLKTLRRKSGKIPWTAYTIAFVELCERFSYYGTTAVCRYKTASMMVVMLLTDNYSCQFHSTASAKQLQHRCRFWWPVWCAGYGTKSVDWLDYLYVNCNIFQIFWPLIRYTVNQFWSYIMPLVGAYVADQYLGRLKTIQWSIAIALVGHSILIVSAIPPVIVHPTASIICFAFGIFFMGIGTGGFKANIAPLIAEQYPETQMWIEKDKNGERVIMDPAITVSRIYSYFYMMINVGSLTGSIAMVFAEKYVGFWLAFLLPTLMFCLCPMVLFYCREKYIQVIPTGSVFGKAYKTIKLAFKGTFSWNPVEL
jgi:POT family proton-dependent oligopeptide transporter